MSDVIVRPRFRHIELGDLGVLSERSMERFVAGGIELLDNMAALEREQLWSVPRLLHLTHELHSFGASDMPEGPDGVWPNVFHIPAGEQQIDWKLGTESDKGKPVNIVYSIAIDIIVDSNSDTRRQLLIKSYPFFEIWVMCYMRNWDLLKPAGAVAITDFNFLGAQPGPIPWNGEDVGYYGWRIMAEAKVRYMRKGTLLP